MNIKYIYCILFLALAAGCKGKGDPAKRINLVENPNLKMRDTAYAPFYAEKYYSPYIVRLTNAYKKAFIQVDSIYGKETHLEKGNREVYYKKVNSLLPKDDLEVFKTIWSLPEVQDLQIADGGNGTILTWIKDRLDKKSGYYIIEVRRNDIEQQSLVPDISYFRIRLRPSHIEIADESAYFVSLDSWRKTQKERH